MTARRWRRTKKQYHDLFDQPESLFHDVETVLWPNGEPEIWFKTRDGLGFRVKVSHGPAGLGITVGQFAGTPVLSWSCVEQEPDEDGRSAVRHGDAYIEMSVTQHYKDAWTQAFKAWYCDTSDPRVVPYPGPKEEWNEEAWRAQYEANVQKRLEAFAQKLGLK